MKKSLYVLFALIFALGVALVPMCAVAQEEEEDAFGNIMHTSYIKIKDVSFAAPAAGAPCKVTVAGEIVGAEDEEETPTVVSGTITYVIGSDKKSVAMTCASNSCSGEIPGAPAGTKVAFAVALVDTFGNTTMTGLPVASADKAADSLVEAKADMDNSPDIVPDNMDILGTSAAFDAERLYVSYKVAGKVDGGTIDPPYIQLYGIKVSNPDIEQNEGLMVGKLWINLPLATDKAVQDKFMPLLTQAKEFTDKINKDDFQNVLNTGMLVLDIGKLMGGNIMEGLLFSAKAQGKTDGGTFVGSILRSALGDNPSGFARVIVLTAANASIDSFMPIPLNCSHYMQVVFKNYDYTVK